MKLRWFPTRKPKNLIRMRQDFPYLTPYPFPVEKITLTDGTEVAITDQGRGRETLVMVHGLGSSMMVWKRNFPFLSQHFRCVGIDLPGYGLSNRASRPLEMTYLASLVSEIIYRKGLRHVTLVGHSMGGQVCLTAGIRYPHTVRRLILAAPAGLERFNRLQKTALRQSFSPDTVRRNTADQIDKTLRYAFHDFEEEAEFMIDDRINISQSPAFEDYCRTISESVNAMINGEVWEQLPLMLQPTLLVFGENDPLIPNRLFSPMSSPRQIAEAGAAQIPHCQLLMFNRCGHFVPFEQPSSFHQAINEFMQA